jgi:hypothetical protein
MSACSFERDRSRAARDYACPFDADPSNQSARGVVDGSIRIAAESFAGSMRTAVADTPRPIPRDFAMAADAPGFQLIPTLRVPAVNASPVGLRGASKTASGAGASEPGKGVERWGSARNVEDTAENPRPPWARGDGP